MPQDQSPVLPSNFQIAYRAQRCAGHPADPYPVWYLKTVALADAGWPDLTGSPGKFSLRSTAYALYSSTGGPPTNQAALDALATQLATDFASWRSQAFDAVYNGVLSPDPSALADETEWRYAAEDCWTRTTSAPLGSEPEEYQHQDPAVSGCVDSTGIVVSKAPAIEIDMPDGKGGQRHGLLSIEGGRLVVVPGTSDAGAGCGCQSLPNNFCATVRNCNSFTVSGLTVQILSGATVVASGTTNGSGQFCCHLANGSYTAQVSGTNWQAQSQAFTMPVSGITMTMVPATGYITLGNCAPFTPPSTITFNDPLGAHTLSLVGIDTTHYSGPTAAFFGCYTAPNQSYTCGPTNTPITLPGFYLNYYVLIGCKVDFKASYIGFCPGTNVNGTNCVMTGYSCDTTPVDVTAFYSKYNGTDPNYGCSCDLSYSGSTGPFSGTTFSFYPNVANIVSCSPIDISIPSIRGTDLSSLSECNVCGIISFLYNSFFVCGHGETLPPCACPTITITP